MVQLANPVLFNKGLNTGKYFFEQLNRFTAVSRLPGSRIVVWLKY
jgi:hypothetical protein